MTQEDLLQMDDTALCWFRRLHMLYEDAHTWFQHSHDNDTLWDDKKTKFLRLQDIANERDQVSIDLCEHIAYVLLSNLFYRPGRPGISLQSALLIRFHVGRMNQGLFFEEARDELHDVLRTLELIR